MKHYWIKIWILFLFCGICSETSAQDKIYLKAYRPMDLMPTLAMKVKKPPAYIFKVGEQDFRPVGWMAKELEPHLKINEAAFAEFGRFTRSVKISRYSLYIAAASWFAAPFVLQAYGNQRNIRPLFVAFYGTSLTGAISHFVFRKKAPKHLVNSVYLYNESLR